VAEKDLQRYLRKGPDLTTRLLLSSLRGSAGPASTLLDVGSGIGAVSFELLATGIGSATLVEASPAYLEKAGAEGQRRKVDTRLNLVLGDFVAVADRLTVSDIVVLDRVVCCYPDYVALLQSAVARSRGLLALSYPRDRWYVRAMIWVENLARRVRGDEFRVFVHPATGFETVVQKAGLRRLSRTNTWVWCADVYGNVHVA
jgi:magnesium-protoporphyrin O-methyltransferase